MDVPERGSSSQESILGLSVGGGEVEMGALGGGWQK